MCCAQRVHLYLPCMDMAAASTCGQTFAGGQDWCPPCSHTPGPALQEGTAAAIPSWQVKSCWGCNEVIPWQGKALACCWHISACSSGPSTLHLGGHWDALPQCPGTQTAPCQHSLASGTERRPRKAASLLLPPAPDI